MKKKTAAAARRPPPLVTESPLSPHSPLTSLSTLSTLDRGVIAYQLGRTPRDLTGVGARCPYGFPAVIETAPVLSDGTPNPTLLYLTCPTLAAAVSRVEAGGGVRAFKQACADDPGLRETLGRVTASYRERRAELLRAGEPRLAGHAGEPGVAGKGDGPAQATARLQAGIGGPEGPDRASCLHAYGAALLAAMSGGLGAGALAAEAGAVWDRFYPALDTCWCTERRCDLAGRVQRRAVIDVGTISVRLLVADVTGDLVQDVVRRTEITRLGEGLRRGDRLLPAAARRTAEMVERLVVEARSQSVEDVLLAGTSATREAVDGREFLTASAARAGARAVVLSGRQEAEAAYAGVTQDVPGDPVVLDIGGGSTELSLRRGIRLHTTSLDLGASKATERWITADPPPTEEVSRVIEAATEILEHDGEAFRSDERSRRLVGVAGTVTTVACLAAGLESYDRDAVHLRALHRDEVETQLRRLSAMTIQERTRLNCVQAGRAPVIVAGAAILLAVMDALGFDQLTVSERDLLDGLAAHGPW